MSGVELSLAPTHRRTGLRRAVAAMAAAVALASCQAEGGFDVVALEEDITTTLTQTYAQDDLTLFGVDCPRDATDAVTGDVFACVADVERQFVRVRVEIAAGLDGWDWTTLDVVHDLDVTEQLVAAEMSETLSDQITLDCGSPRIRVLPIGSVIECEAVDSGRNAVRVLLHVNGAGQTGWEILG